MTTAAFQNAVAQILRPIVRTLIARSVQFPEFSDLVKAQYVDVCGRYFRLGDRKLTDSRISLLTGLQRKDIRSIRAKINRSESAPPSDMSNPLSRIIAYWRGQAAYRGRHGKPNPVPRSAPEGHISFEGLVAAISRDIHPRTVFDEMLRRGLISHDAETDQVSLRATAFVPSQDDDALVAYFGANVGDHAQAAAENLSVAPEQGPNFERAVHYDNLTPDALSELNEMARRLQTETLEKLNGRALSLQERDDGKANAVGRFRCGAYVFMERLSDPKKEI